MTEVWPPVEARPPDSDLDLLALWTSTVDASATVAALSARHAAVVREVGLAQAAVDALTTEADRCFLKHYCVPLAGRDRRPACPRCRPSRGLADGFNDDLPVVVDRLRSLWTAGGTPRSPPCGRRHGVCCSAVATIESVSHGDLVDRPDRGAPRCWYGHHHSGPTWTSRCLTWSAGGGTADGAADLFCAGRVARPASLARPD